MKKRNKKTSFKGKVRRNAEETKQSGRSFGYLNLPNGISTFSPEPGSRVKFDILPYNVTDENHPDRNDEFEIAIPGTLWWKRPFKIHRGIGGEGDSVVCPTSIGKSCPICKYVKDQYSKGVDNEEIKPIKAKERNLYVVIPKGNKKLEEKPHIWECSQYLFQNLLTDELEENEKYEVFPSLDEGFTLKVRFDSKTMGNSKPFAEASRIDFEERDEQYDDDILDEIPNLDEILNILPYNKLEAKFFEMDDEPAADEIEQKEEPEEEEEEEKPKRQKRNKKQPKEDEDEEDKDDIPFDTEKEKSSKKDDKCPHGYTFGVDTDEYNECNNCKVWDECFDKKEGIE